MKTRAHHSLDIYIEKSIINSSRQDRGVLLLEVTQYTIINCRQSAPHKNTSHLPRQRWHLACEGRFAMMKKCRQCGKEFKVWPSEIKRENRKYCSRQCSSRARRTRIVVICQQCGKKFEVWPSDVKAGNGKYCSMQCMGKWMSKNRIGKNNSNWRGGKVACTCQQCGKKFESFQAEIKGGWGKFCSRKCHGKWRSKNRIGENSANWKGGEVTTTCQQCDGSFEILPSRIEKGGGKFCSLQCFGKWKSENLAGERSPNWQGGKSFEPYPSTFNTPFKRKIRERDDYTCAICGKPGKSVHHINYVKNDTTPGNCITLCRSCHGKTNTKRKYWQKHLACLITARHSQTRHGTVVSSQLCSGG